MPTPPDPHQVQEMGFQELLGAARTRQDAALDELFRRFYPKVERMVHHGLAGDMRLKRPWLAARFSTGDVVQEVFRSLLRDLSGFEGQTEEAFVGYLAMVVRNRLLDAVRYHEAAQRDGRRTKDVEEGKHAASPAAGPATGVAHLDELEILHGVLETFPERERLLLRGRLEQGVRFADLAVSLGFSSKSAAKRAFYSAQAQLAIRMRKTMDSPENAGGAEA